MGNVLTPLAAAALAMSGVSCRADVQVAPRFQVGDRVRARNLNPVGHTRLPGYVRGHVGTIECDYGTFIFPDTNAHGQGQRPQHCYRVRMTARELWGPGAGERDVMYVDLFDDYLDPA